jgi:hypothetical protein
VCVDSDMVESTDKISWSSSWYAISMPTDDLLHAGIGASCGVGKRVTGMRAVQKTGYWSEAISTSALHIILIYKIQSANDVVKSRA